MRKFRGNGFSVVKKLRKIDPEEFGEFHPDCCEAREEKLGERQLLVDRDPQQVSPKLLLALLKILLVQAL
jgi:hypothetical protein